MVLRLREGRLGWAEVGFPCRALWGIAVVSDKQQKIGPSLKDNNWDRGSFLCLELSEFVAFGIQIENSTNMVQTAVNGVTTNVHYARLWPPGEKTASSLLIVLFVWDGPKFDKRRDLPSLMSDLPLLRSDLLSLTSDLPLLMSDEPDVGIVRWAERNSLTAQR